MDFVTIPGGSYTLGWRFQLPEDAQKGIDAFLPMEEFLTRFSKERTVTLADFEIATTALSVEELIEDLDADAMDEILTIADLCDAVDAQLAPRGLRVPSEDELEAAAGGSLFAWGDAIPEGSPYGSESRFRGHRQPTASGLMLSHDTYANELTRAALKMGDGGEAVCGGYPWPVGWMSLSPAWRLGDDVVEELFFEFLEQAVVHPVRR